MPVSAERLGAAVTLLPASRELVTLASYDKSVLHP